MYEPLDPPSRHSAESTAPLDAVVMRGLARNPAERWPTARAMALALEDCAPPASALHVGAMVERLAYKTLTERAALIGATLQIESAVGKGTTIYVRWTSEDGAGALPS